MPALNFKARFAAPVSEGSKRHTIRAWRKYPFQVGANLSFFTGMRTKHCRRLRADSRCRAATPIEMNMVRRRVTLNQKALTARQIAQLARRDGFANVDEFWRFFAETHGSALKGQLIEWSP